jgi:hypothetical protein
MIHKDGDQTTKGDRGDGVDDTYFEQLNALIDGGFYARVGPSAGIVYDVYKRFRNPQTELAWPDVDKIAELTGLSAPTVKRAKRVLVECGVPILRERGRRGEHLKTEGRASVYEVRLQQGSSVIPVRRNRDQSRLVTGITHDPPRDNGKKQGDGTSKEVLLGGHQRSLLSVPHIEREDLADAVSLNRLYRWAVGMKIVTTSEEDQVFFFARAKNTLRCATANAGGMFSTWLRENPPSRTIKPSLEDEDNARRDLKFLVLGGE